MNTLSQIMDVTVIDEINALLQEMFTSFVKYVLPSWIFSGLHVVNRNKVSSNSVIGSIHQVSPSSEGNESSIMMLLAPGVI